MVFTVPEEIAAIAYQNKEVVYGILFQATAETLKTIAADPKHLGAEIGFFAVLAQLGTEPACSIPTYTASFPAEDCPRMASAGSRCRAGFFSARPSALPPLSPPLSGVSAEGVRFRQVTVLNRLGIPSRKESPSSNCLARMKGSEWVVYAKRPFAGPQQVLDYVGRYTHRVAISNNRLLDIENGQVRFQWKDYRDGIKSKRWTLSADEFIRRFLLHVLPDGFQRIRYYGFLGNRDRRKKLALCRHLLGMQTSSQTNSAEGLSRTLSRTHGPLVNTIVRTASMARW